MDGSTSRPERVLTGLPTPQLISIDHAVRWIATGQRPLSLDQRKAVNDIVDITNSGVGSPLYNDARVDFLLSLANGLLSATSLPWFFDRRNSGFNPDYKLMPKEWNSFFAPYTSKLEASPNGLIELEAPITIPEKLWRNKYVSWTSNAISFRGRDMQCILFDISVDFNDLKLVFSRGDEVIEKPKTTRLHTKEHESLLKLLIGISVEQYGYDPTEKRSQVPKNISDDLAHLGIQMDNGTILKFLRMASEYMPPNFSGDELRTKSDKR